MEFLEALFLRIKMGYCKGAWRINVSSKDWCALATKNLSFFFKFSIPEKVTLTPNINLNKNIIIYANIFPQTKVDLLGRINVGMAKTKTNIKVK